MLMIMRCSFFFSNLLAAALLGTKTQYGMDMSQFKLSSQGFAKK